MSNDNKLHVLSHPLIDAELSKLRQKSTNPKEFREVHLIHIHFETVAQDRNIVGRRDD